MGGKYAYINGINFPCFCTLFLVPCSTSRDGFPGGEDISSLRFLIWPRDVIWGITCLEVYINRRRWKPYWSRNMGDWFPGDKIGADICTEMRRYLRCVCRPRGCLYLQATRSRKQRIQSAKIRTRRSEGLRHGPCYPPLRIGVIPYYAFRTSEIDRIRFVFRIYLSILRNEAVTRPKCKYVVKFRTASSKLCS